jgi:peptidoglycan/xylan/chitin deacetylase (PgdA/CDA1 family)
MSSNSQSIMTVSLDLELLWGLRDHIGPGHPYMRWLEGTRPAITRLLALFAEFQVSACWAAVGHLFYSRYDGENGKKHPDMPRPTGGAGTGDWYDQLPLGDYRTAPLWYGSDIIDEIKACPVAQEIGCHTFSHVDATDPGVGRELFRAELRKCLALAEAKQIRLRSLVFPRNRVAYQDVLRDCGFVAYRARNSEWYWRMPAKPLVLAGRVGSEWLGLPPPVGHARIVEGVAEIPHSMFFAPFWAVGKYIPERCRVVQAVRGMNKAVRHGGIFHLYSHPHNFGHHTDKMLNALRRILEHAARLRDRGELQILPMGEIGAMALGGKQP